MKFFLSFVFKKYSSVLLKRQKNYKIENKMGVGGGGVVGGMINICIIPREDRKTIGFLPYI